MEEGDRRLVVPTEGTARMLMEDGAWKIAEEEWTLLLDRAVPIFDVQPFMREGQRPVTAPGRLDPLRSGPYNARLPPRARPAAGPRARSSAG